MMSHRIFSTRSRPAHAGPYALDRLARTRQMPAIASLTMPEISFSRPERPFDLVNAMADHQTMLDLLRDGLVNQARAEIPDDPAERTAHLKGFGYFADASMVGAGPIPDSAWLDQPRHNPGTARLAEQLTTRQTKTLAAGIDQTMAELKETAATPPRAVGHHQRALVFIYEYRRDPRPGEPGTAWLQDAQPQRASLLASETAVVIANYIRLLGFDAKAHSLNATDIDLHQLAVAAGLGWAEADGLSLPWLDRRFGLAAVTTDMEIEPDLPLAPREAQPSSELTGLHWKLGSHAAKSAFNKDPFAKRDYQDSPFPMERIKRVAKPTTYIDEAHIPRVPKRADMFARAQFGDMGETNQKAAAGGFYVRKSPVGSAQRRVLGAFVLLQDGEPDPAGPRPGDAAENAANIKAASYFLGVDAVGLSRCPDWAWYSHDARGEAIIPTHDQAISMVVDQGFETMEGASGDDWISVAQSMRAYLRFALLGGVIARQLRTLGYQAKAHTVMDGEVLQPPLLLLSGLGEVSRIGEVILHPFLGPRLKSGVVTTDMPMAHDQPIDFGLQNFCENCNKCARECPSGAITAGPKLMFNGYEIWKSDSQKCTSYRITTPGGAMCGRCMKTCPWNLEGLFAEAPFRWAASNLPQAAKMLAWLDDKAGRGNLNEVKKWWWDIGISEDGSYRPPDAPVNKRGISPQLKLDYADQTLAVYPAPLAPHPWPWPFPMDREAGIAAYQSMISATEHQKRLAEGDESRLHRFQPPAEAPVLALQVTQVTKLSDKITSYELRRPDGADLPAWRGGAHLDIVVAPEFLRQYSMCGDPADRSVYEIAVLREDDGRGGSALMHRIFSEGRRIFASPPINHFELDDRASHAFLMGGGIGVTPMIAFAHELHRQGRPFDLHYSVPDRAAAAFLDRLQDSPFADRVHLHISAEGSRADFAAIFRRSGPPDAGWHIYSCGPDAYMEAVDKAAAEAGFAEDNRHREYFSVPEMPELENHPFRLKLARSGQLIEVAAEQRPTDALLAAGVAVDVKCSDGLCGVCKCDLLSGEVEHRDFVLSARQRETSLILCQSRAAEKDGLLEIDL